MTPSASSSAPSLESSSPPSDHITPADLRAWGACYDDAKVAGHFAGRDALTPQEIVACQIPDADKVWVLSRVLARRDPWRAFDLAVHCARLALPYVEADWRERVEEIVEKVAGLRGKSEEECWAVWREADDLWYAARAAGAAYQQIIAKALELLGVAL